MQILVALISTLSRINHNKAKHFETFFKNLKQVSDGILCDCRVYLQQCDELMGLLHIPH